MIKVLFVALLLSFISSPVFAASEQLEMELDRSIEENEKFLNQGYAPDSGQLIIQQQELLRTMDEVDLFRSLEDARKALQRTKTQQRYVK